MTMTGSKLDEGNLDFIREFYLISLIEYNLSIFISLSCSRIVSRGLTNWWVALEFGLSVWFS